MSSLFLTLANIALWFALSYLAQVPFTEPTISGCPTVQIFI
jgi:hypothetical protein